MFKECSCKTIWDTRHDFLNDKNVVLKGYQVHFEELRLGLFFFNHALCGTTLVVHADAFIDLYSGPIFKGRKTGSHECPAYCLIRENLKPCPAQCECAYIREVMQLIIRFRSRP